MKKQSEILHISLDGNWIRIHGRYRDITSLSSSTVKPYIEEILNNYCVSYWWANGAKHPARKLEFMPAQEYLLLC